MPLQRPRKCVDAPCAFSRDTDHSHTYSCVEIGSPWHQVSQTHGTIEERFDKANIPTVVSSLGISGAQGLSSPISLLLARAKSYSALLYIRVHALAGRKTLVAIVLCILYVVSPVQTVPVLASD